MNILRNRIQLIERLLANVLCGAAEHAYRRERARAFTVRQWSRDRGMLRDPGALYRCTHKLAAHYDLIPERTDDDGSDDE